MLVFVSIYVILALLRYGLDGSRRLRLQLYPVVFAALYVFVAFRYEVGCDWWGYLNQWNIQSEASLADALIRHEPGWWSLMHFLQATGVPYPWLNVAAATIFFVGVHALARRQPDPLGFLILLYPVLIINMPMSGLRQASAIGIMAVAFAAMIDRRVVRFGLLTLLASTFHQSAILFLLLLPLVGGKYSRKRLAVAAILGVPGIFALMAGAAAEVATSRYVDTDIDAAGAAFRVGLLLLAGVAYLLRFGRVWRTISPADHKLVTIGAMMMVSLIVLVPISSVIGDRLGYYLIPIQTIFFARLPYLPLGRYRPIYSCAPYLILGLVLVVWTSLSHHFDLCYVPYQSWLLGFPAASDSGF